MTFNNLWISFLDQIYSTTISPESIPSVPITPSQLPSSPSIEKHQEEKSQPEPEPQSEHNGDTTIY